MPARNHDLHGNVPDSSPTAILVIDVINDLEFDTGDAVLEQALPMARRLKALLDRARAADIPVIYVNDNFGKWRSDMDTQLRHCLDEDVRGRPMVELLRPAKDDYFVLKPKHSGFYNTTLDVLLEYLQAETLIITGLTTENCVLFTASDAYMRDLNLFVPRDCVAAMDEETHEAALAHMEKILKVNTSPSDELELEELARDLLP